MEKTEEIKRYLKFQRKVKALKLAEDLGCKYACEVFKISRQVSTIGKENTIIKQKKVFGERRENLVLIGIAKTKKRLNLS